MTKRYGVVDLTTGTVHDEADTLDEAVDDLDDADLLSYEAEDGPRPELVIIDFDTSELIDLDKGQVVRSWLDAFSGAWRRMLEPAGSA